MSSFARLDEVAKSLRKIEALYRRARRRWPFADAAFNPRIATHLASFRVFSPPEFIVVVDPAWLSVFISILGGYKSVKESVRELNTDTRSILETIRGLTRAEIEDLEIAVELAMQGIQEWEVNPKRTMERKLSKIAER